MSRIVKQSCAQVGALSCLLMLGIFQPAHAAEQKAAGEKEAVETFVAAVSRRDSAPDAKNAFRDVAQVMDFEEMAKRSFGDSGWVKFSAAEQKEVTALFKRLIEIRFFPRWRRVFQSGRYEVTGQAKDGADSLVSGALLSGGKKNDLTFRLVKVRDGFRLVSMKLKDKDLLERTSVRMKRGLKQKGAAGLIAHLKKRTEQGPAEVSNKQQLDELISGGK